MFAPTVALKIAPQNNMMKKILGIVGLAVIAVIIALNINAGLKKDATFDVALANVEALGQGEDDSINCGSICGYSYCGWIVVGGTTAVALYWCYPHI